VTHWIDGLYPSLNWNWVLLGSLAFLALSVGGVALVGVLLTRLPATYFSEPRPRAFWIDTQPVLRWTVLLVKNIIGAVLVALGIILAMPGVPGPGILTILVGIMLIDFPGKRRLECWLIGRPKILVAVNRMRQRYGKAPFVLRDPSD
jgi:hypothetical protein